MYLSLNDANQLFSLTRNCSACVEKQKKQTHNGNKNLKCKLIKNGKFEGCEKMGEFIFMWTWQNNRRKVIKLKAQKQNNINQRFFMQLDLWNTICKKRQPTKTFTWWSSQICCQFPKEWKIGCLFFFRSCSTFSNWKRFS